MPQVSPTLHSAHRRTLTNEVIPIGCNCGKKRNSATYVATFKDGTKRTYSTEADARRAVATRGGSYKQT